MKPRCFTHFFGHLCLAAAVLHSWLPAADEAGQVAPVTPAEPAASPAATTEAANALPGFAVYTPAHLKLKPGVQLWRPTGEAYTEGGSLRVAVVKDGPPVAVAEDNLPTWCAAIETKQQAQELAELLVWGTHIECEKDFAALKELYKIFGYDTSPPAAGAVKHEYGDKVRESESGGFDVSFTVFRLGTGMGAQAQVERFTLHVAGDAAVTWQQADLYLTGPLLNWQSCAAPGATAAEIATQAAAKQRLETNRNRLIDEVFNRFARPTILAAAVKHPQREVIAPATEILPPIEADPPPPAAGETGEAAPRGAGVGAAMGVGTPSTPVGASLPLEALVAAAVRHAPFSSGSGETQLPPVNETAGVPRHWETVHPGRPANPETADPGEPYGNWAVWVPDGWEPVKQPADAQDTVANGSGANANTSNVVSTGSYRNDAGQQPGQSDQPASPQSDPLPSQPIRQQVRERDPDPILVPQQMVGVYSADLLENMYDCTNRGLYFPQEAQIEQPPPAANPPPPPPAINDDCPDDTPVTQAEPQGSIQAKQVQTAVNHDDYDEF